MRQWKKRGRLGILAVAAIVCSVFVSLEIAQAYELHDTVLGEKTSISGYLKNNTVWRAFRHPNELMMFKWEARAEMDSEVNPALAYHLELKYFYDAVFDVSDTGIGDSDWAEDDYESTAKLPYQDYIREAYFDFRCGDWFTRLGKQQVVWGKSDGLRLLDVVNPFDWYDWTMAEFEENRIPIWMLRLEHEFPAIFGNMQFLWSWQYVPSPVAPAYTPWSFNAVDTFQALSARTGAFVFNPNLWTKGKGSSANTWALDRSGYGARWSQQIGQFHYTLNWLRKWNDFVFARPNYDMGTPDAPYLYTMESRLVTILGASFDYNWDEIMGMQNLVARGELAFYKGDMSYGSFYGDGDPIHYYDHLDYVVGLDKYFFGDWWFSAQMFQIIIMDYDREKDALINFGMDRRDHVENAFTLFVMKDFGMLPGSAECLLYYHDDGVWWIRPRVNYEIIRNKVVTTLTANVFWGDDQNFIGNFYQNDMLRLEVKYMFQ